MLDSKHTLFEQNVLLSLIVVPANNELSHAQAIVMQHLRNIIGAATKGRSTTGHIDKWHYPHSVDNVFQSMFRYFDQRWESGTLSEQTRHELQALPCVPVQGNRLVKAGF